MVCTSTAVAEIHAIMEVVGAVRVTKAILHQYFLAGNVHTFLIIRNILSRWRTSLALVE